MNNLYIYENDKSMRDDRCRVADFISIQSFLLDKSHHSIKGIVGSGVLLIRNIIQLSEYLDSALLMCAGQTHVIPQASLSYNKL